MSGLRPEGASKRAVPTLTEVLHIEQPQMKPSGAAAQSLSPVPLEGVVADAFAPAPDANALSTPTSASPNASLSPDGFLPSTQDEAEAGSRLTEQVLGEVQRNIDLMLEYRLRETLTPALARMTDTFIRDTRNELATTLREIVARAVEAELAKLRRT